MASNTCPGTMSASINTKMPATLIAYDGSGSTGGNCNAFYHEKTQKIVAEYPDAQIVLWDTSPRVISHAQLSEINESRKGFGGTDSAAIARYVRSQGFHGHLIIITDGQVGADNIDACARELGSAWPFTRVTAHLIDTGGAVNMSVTCPFTRVAPHTVYSYSYRRPAGYEQIQEVSVSAADMEALRLIDTVTSPVGYEVVADAIERVVIARTMGTTGDPSLRDAILAMKKRIVAEQARLFGDSESVTVLTAALETGRIADAMTAAAKIHNEYYGEERGWSARISRLISMCEGALRGAFDFTAVNSAIHSDRVRRAAVVTPVALPAESVASATSATPFVCPITLDIATDIILLVAEGKPILEGLDKSVVTDILECPLNLFQYPEVVAALRDRLDHPISLTAYRAALEAGSPILTGPMTRRPLLAGGICLGQSEEHCAATTWTLAQLTTGRASKLVGNPDLWFACLWLLLQREQAGEHLADLETLFRENLTWRLRNHTTYISLTGLPEFPSTRVPLATAIWYVFASSRFTAGSDPRRELIRTHMPHIKELLEIKHVCLSGYEFPEGVIPHLRRVRVMLSMLSWVKHDRWALPELMRGLTQGSVPGPTASQVGTDVREREHVPTIVPVDGLPSAERLTEVHTSLPGLWSTLSDNELLGLATLVDPSKSAGDIPLSFDWTPPVHTVLPGRVEWAYGVEPVPAYHVRMCAATCRPYYTDSETGESWITAAERIHGIAPNKMISLNKQFGMFVVKYGRYPNPSEFLVFLYNRYIYHGKHKALPAQITQFISETFDEFSEIMETVTPTEFVRRFTESTAIPVRMSLEKQK